ncbi:MAG TPA: hypothetical protein EYN66_22450 [Myxococcales bacterium]|nr:hypothetical protein [Myxococcales bacterium]
MPRPSKDVRQAEDGTRTFDGRAWLSHYRHVSNGHRKSPDCRMCEQGLGAIMPIDNEETPAVGVVQDTGTDEERPSPPTHDDDWTRIADAMLHREGP